MMDAVKNRKEQRERNGMVPQVVGLKGPVGRNRERSWTLSKTLKGAQAARQGGTWGTSVPSTGTSEQTTKAGPSGLSEEQTAVCFSVCTALSRDLWPLETASLLSRAVRLMLPSFLPSQASLAKTAAAAESLRLCLTRCNPFDCSPPGSSVHGILQARVTGVGCHSLLQGPFLTQGSNLGLLHCRQILYHLNHQGSPLAKAASPQMWLCFTVNSAFQGTFHTLCNCEFSWI